MSKPLFEFVKVAAGEAVDTGSLVCYMQPDVRAMVRELSFGRGGKAPHDFWFLRPAESPDAGREGFIEKVMDEVEGPHPYPRRSEICSMFENAMRLHWPASTPVTREEIEQWANYQYPVEGINVRSTQYANIDKRLVALATFDYLQGKAITPADPGSQVEAVDFTEWWINEGWQIRKNGTFIQIGASGTPMLGRPDDRIKSVNELFTLYKQSL